MLLVAAGVIQWDSAQPDGSPLGGIILLLIMVGFATWGVVVWSRRQAALERYMASKELKYIGNRLPPTMQPPSIAWMPEYRVKNCFAGQRNGFEVALFQTVIQQGESPITRTMVAVRRPPFPLELGMLLGDSVSVDKTSTPGWIIASYKGGNRTPERLDALLSALTVPSPSAEQGDERSSR